MRQILFALAVAVLVPGAVIADDKTDVMATIRQVVDGFNKGDANAAVAACADEMSIIDEFPPYEWHGAGAMSKWLGEYDANAKAEGITEGKVTLGKPRHIDVVKDRAYVVIPSNYSFKKQGKPAKEVGAAWTFTLHKTDAGWRITGWSWAKP